MFQLAFPQPGMLEPNELQTMEKAADAGLSKAGLQHLAEKIRAKLNPHPANQKTENVPSMEGERLQGMQHKYRETVLFFPSEVSSEGYGYSGSLIIIQSGTILPRVLYVLLSLGSIHFGGFIPNIQVQQWPSTPKLLEPKPPSKRRSFHGRGPHGHASGAAAFIS